MEVVCTGKKNIILFFTCFHDEFLVLSLPTLLEKYLATATVKVRFLVYETDINQQ